MLGAQNMHFEDKGAFTGEVSPPMLQSFGVTHVILGHSERRHIFHENDELINAQVLAAVQPSHDADSVRRRDPAGTRRRPTRSTVVLRQLQHGLAVIKRRRRDRVVIAYEPVWAIGTGRTATPEQAQSVHGAIREALGDHFGQESPPTRADPLWRQRHRRKC